MNTKWKKNINSILNTENTRQNQSMKAYDYISTCKWLFTWKIVNPSESISLSIAFGVASNVDTKKTTNKQQNNLQIMLHNIWQGLTFSTAKAIHTVNKPIMKILTPSDSRLIWYSSCSITRSSCGLPCIFKSISIQAVWDLEED